MSILFIEQEFASKHLISTSFLSAKSGRDYFSDPVDYFATASGERVSPTQLDWYFSNFLLVLQDHEIGDMKFFLEKLINTGFLD